MVVGTGKVICVSFAHIMLGAFMIVCGAVQGILHMKYLWLDTFYAGIWVGIWMILTGVTGIIASFKNKLFFYFERRIGVAPTRKLLDAFATASLIFSAISSLLGLAIIGYYAYTGAVFWKVYLSHRHYVVIVCFTCLFAIAETITGACAAIYIYEPVRGVDTFANRIAPFDGTGQVGDRQQPPEEGQVSDNVPAQYAQLHMAQLKA